MLLLLMSLSVGMIWVVCVQAIEKILNQGRGTFTGVVISGIISIIVIIIVIVIVIVIVVISFVAIVVTCVGASFFLVGTFCCDGNSYLVLPADALTSNLCCGQLTRVL